MSPYRGRWDAMANPKSVKEYAVLSADPIAIGDLVWFDKRTQTVKAAAHADCWTGSTDGAQGKFAENFVGVARSAHAANDASNLKVRVESRGVYNFALSPSAIMEVGDLVNAVKDPAGNILLNGTVGKGATISAINTEHTTRAREIAIGRVAVRSTIAVDNVDVEIMGTREAGGGPRLYLTS